MARTTRPPDDAPIHDAIAALDRGDAAAALHAALDAWRRRPDPTLAAAIEAISTRARAPAPLEIRGRKAGAVAAWLALARKRDPVDVPALLETLTEVSAPRAVTRMLA